MRVKNTQCTKNTQWLNTLRMAYRVAHLMVMIPHFRKLRDQRRRGTKVLVIACTTLEHEHLHEGVGRTCLVKQKDG